MELELEEIYKIYFQDVYYFVLAMGKDPHIAEEITQETFFKALKGVKHFQGKCSIKSWLCQIARNEYISYTRKKHRTDQELTEQAYSDGKTDGPEQRMLRKDEAMTDPPMIVPSRSKKQISYILSSFSFSIFSTCLLQKNTGAVLLRFFRIRHTPVLL